MGTGTGTGTVSFRDHIRWGSEPPSEPTSTLVLTSPDHYFVDIRVFTAGLVQPQSREITVDGSPSPSSSPSPSPSLSPSLALAREHLDWAIGGTSASTQRNRPDGTVVSHSVFTHWVDSRTREPEHATDEGDMLPQADGTTLETGRMVNPATGLESDYEELWRDTAAEEVPALAKWTVLQLHDDSLEKRGMFVQLGQYAQGVLRVGDVFTAERWEWEPSLSKWARSFRAGDKQADSLEDIIPVSQKPCRRGDKVEARSGTWSVLEASG